MLKNRDDSIVGFPMNLTHFVYARAVKNDFRRRFSPIVRVASVIWSLTLKRACTGSGLP